MLKDRYQNRFLTLGPKHSLTYPARPAYVVPNLQYMVVDNMHRHTRVSPFIWVELEQRTRWLSGIKDHLKSGGRP